MNTFMRTPVCIAAILLGAAYSAYATPVKYNLAGVISEALITELPTYGISVGDEFHGSLTYESWSNDISAPYVSNPSSQGLHLYFSGRLFLEIDIRGQTFNSGNGGWYYVSVINDGPSGDSIVFYSNGDDLEKTPWNTADTRMRFHLQDNSGTAIASSVVPTQLDLADWSAVHQIALSGELGFTGSEWYSIKADITSITPVSDRGTSALMLLFAIGPLLLGLRFKRTQTR